MLTQGSNAKHPTLRLTPVQICLLWAHIVASFARGWAMRVNCGEGDYTLWSKSIWHCSWQVLFSYWGISSHALWFEYSPTSTSCFTFCLFYHNLCIHMSLKCVRPHLSALQSSVYSLSERHSATLWRSDAVLETCWWACRVWQFSFRLTSFSSECIMCRAAV